MKPNDLKGDVLLSRSRKPIAFNAGVNLIFFNLHPPFYTEGRKVIIPMLISETNATDDFSNTPGSTKAKAPHTSLHCRKDSAWPSVNFSKTLGGHDGSLCTTHTHTHTTHARGEDKKKKKREKKKEALLVRT